MSPDGGKMSSIKYHSGDITKLKVDAIVNAANQSLSARACDMDMR